MTKEIRTLQERIGSEIRGAMTVQDLQVTGRALTQEVAAIGLRLSMPTDNSYDFSRNNRYAMSLSTTLTQELSSAFLGLTL